MHMLADLTSTDFNIVADLASRYWDDKAFRVCMGMIEHDSVDAARMHTDMLTGAKPAVRAVLRAGYEESFT